METDEVEVLWDVVGREELQLLANTHQALSAHYPSAQGRNRRPQPPTCHLTASPCPCRALAPNSACLHLPQAHHACIPHRIRSTRRRHGAHAYYTHPGRGPAAAAAPLTDLCSWAHTRTVHVRPVVTLRERASSLQPPSPASHGVSCFTCAPFPAAASVSQSRRQSESLLSAAGVGSHSRPGTTRDRAPVAGGCHPKTPHVAVHSAAPSVLALEPRAPVVVPQKAQPRLAVPAPAPLTPQRRHCSRAQRTTPATHLCTS